MTRPRSSLASLAAAAAAAAALAAAAPAAPPLPRLTIPFPITGIFEGQLLSAERLLEQGLACNVLGKGQLRCYATLAQARAASPRKQGRGCSPGLVVWRAPGQTGDETLQFFTRGLWFDLPHYPDNPAADWRNAVSSLSTGCAGARLADLPGGNGPRLDRRARSEVRDLGPAGWDDRVDAVFRR